MAGNKFKKKKKKVKPDSYKLEYTGLYGDKMSLTGTARQVVMHIMKQQLD